MAKRLVAGISLLIGWLGMAGCAADKTGTLIPPVQPIVTTVYLVRHAEKDNASNPADPTLSAAGEARAQDLRQALANTTPAALFTTETRRTRATLAPLATATNLVPLVYDALQPTVLAGRIRAEYVGKTVVVVGHSNTVLPQIEALGAPRPLTEIGENEYDYLFKVSLQDGVVPAVVVSKYGK